MRDLDKDPAKETEKGGGELGESNATKTVGGEGSTAWLLSSRGGRGLGRGQEIWGCGKEWFRSREERQSCVVENLD